MPRLSPTGLIARWFALLVLLFAALLTGQAQETGHAPSPESKDFTTEEKKAWDDFWVLWENRGAATVMEESERLCRAYPDNLQFIALRAMLLRETGENAQRRQLLWDWWDRTEKRKGQAPQILLSWSRRWHPPEKTDFRIAETFGDSESRLQLALWLVYAAEDFPEERERLRAAMSAQVFRETKSDSYFSTLRKGYERWFDDETWRAFFYGKTNEEDPVIWFFLRGNGSLPARDYSDQDDIAWTEKVVRQFLREERVCALLFSPRNRPVFTEAFRWTIQQKLSRATRQLLEMCVVDSLTSQLLPHDGQQFNLDDHKEEHIPGWTEDDWDQLHLLTTGDRYHATPYLEPPYQHPAFDLRLAFALRVWRADFVGMAESLRGGMEDAMISFGPALARAFVRSERLDKPIPWAVVAGMVADFYEKELAKYGTMWMLPTDFGKSSSPDPFWNQEDKDSPVFYGPPELLPHPSYRCGKFFSELFDTLPPESRFPLWWELRKLNKPSLRELDEAWLMSERDVQESFRLPEKADDLFAALAAHVRDLPRWFPREAEAWLPFLLHEANWPRLDELPLMLRRPGRELLEREAAGPEGWAARAWLETWTFAEWEWKKEEYWRNFKTRAPYWMGEPLLHTYAVDAAWVPRRTAFPGQFRSLLEDPKSPHGLTPVLRLALVTLLFRQLGADVLPPSEVTDLFLRLSPKLSPRDWAGLVKRYAHPSDLFRYDLELPEREAQARRRACSREFEAWVRSKVNDL